MTDNKANKSDKTPSAGLVESKAEPKAAGEMPQSEEAWPTWCTTCQALRSGEHTCKKPESEADNIRKPEPVYRRRLSHESGTLRADRERKGNDQ